MTVCHVNEIRKDNKTSTSPLESLHELLAKLTTVLGNEIKCAIPQFIFYTPAVVKTYKHSQVLGPSLTCRMQRNWS